MSWSRFTGDKNDYTDQSSAACRCSHDAKDREEVEGVRKGGSIFYDTLIEYQKVYREYMGYAPEQKLDLRTALIILMIEDIDEMKKEMEEQEVK